MARELELSLREKVFKTIEKYNLVKNGDIIFVGLSGGKDSFTTLITLLDYVSTTGINAQIKGFHINLGYFYSDNLEKFLEDFCKERGIEFKVVRVKELGLDIEAIAYVKRRPVCSICGQVKRYLLNKVPREEGATKVATGHHLDDFLTFYYKNFFYKNFDWNFKILPKLKSTNPKLLTKIRPLIFVSEDEIRNFVKEQNIQVFSCACVYSIGGGCFVDPKTLKFKNLLEHSEETIKNFKLEMMRSIVTFNKKYAKDFYKETELNFCERCGEPTSKNICSFCRLLDFSKTLKQRAQTQKGGFNG